MARRRARGRSREGRREGRAHRHSPLARSARRGALQFASSSRARPGCFSTATTSAARGAGSPCRPEPRRDRGSGRRLHVDASPASWEPRLCGQISPSASACSSTRSTRSAPGTSGRLAHGIAGLSALRDDRLRRLVLRPHQRQRLVGPEVAPPVSLRPSPDRSASARPRRRFRQRRRGAREPPREPAQDGVRERDRALEPRARGQAPPTR